MMSSRKVYTRQFPAIVMYLEPLRNVELLGVCVGEGEVHKHHDHDGDGDTEVTKGTASLKSTNKNITNTY